MYDTTRIADDFSLVANRYGARAKLQAKIGAALIEKTSPYIRQNARLVDVGAGSGELTKRWPVASAVAVDIAVGMCEEAQKKGLATINASAEQLPLQAGKADVLVSNLMLQWARDPEVFFAESFRVLKTGGIFAFTHFAKGTLCDLEKAFIDAGQGARVSEFHVPDEMVQKVKQSGFEVVLSTCETLHEPYHGVMDLCGFIRDIGAANKRDDRPRGLLTPRMLRRVTSAYPRSGAGITASWVVQWLVARKP